MKNLTLPIPFSASPPSLCHTLATFQYIQSICLTHTVLQQYTLAAQTHAAQLKHLFFTMCHQHPHFLPQLTVLFARRNVRMIASPISNFVNSPISALIISMGATSSPFASPPLIYNNPSLASDLNLPPPTHLLNFCPNSSYPTTPTSPPMSTIPMPFLL